MLVAGIVIGLLVDDEGGPGLPPGTLGVEKLEEGQHSLASNAARSVHRPPAHRAALLNHPLHDGKLVVEAVDRGRQGPLVPRQLARIQALDLLQSTLVGVEVPEGTGRARIDPRKVAALLADPLELCRVEGLRLEQQPSGRGGVECAALARCESERLDLQAGPLWVVVRVEAALCHPLARLLHRRADLSEPLEDCSLLLLVGCDAGVLSGCVAHMLVDGAAHVVHQLHRLELTVPGGVEHRVVAPLAARLDRGDDVIVVPVRGGGADRRAACTRVVRVNVRVRALGPLHGAAGLESKPQHADITVNGGGGAEDIGRHLVRIRAADAHCPREEFHAGGEVGQIRAKLGRAAVAAADALNAEAGVRLVHGSDARARQHGRKYRGRSAENLEDVEDVVVREALDAHTARR